MRMPRPTVGRFVQSASFILLMLLAGSEADASVIYAYTGKPFTDVLNDIDVSYTTNQRVSGSFTLEAGLAANLVDTLVSPVSFDFFDGVKHLTQANVVPGQDDDNVFFRVWTDGAGAITFWNIYLFNDLGSGYEEIITAHRPTSGGTVDLGEKLDCNVRAGGSCVSRGLGFSAGTWSTSSLPAPDPTPVPEPGTLTLAGITVLGLMAGMRRRTHRA